MLTHELETPHTPKNVVWVGNNGTTDTFCNQQCVVLNPESGLRDYAEIPFALDCGTDNICDSELKIDGRFLGTKNNSYVLGSPDLLLLEIQIYNSNETAYLTELNITLPDNIHFKNQSTMCEVLANNLECLFPDPIGKDEMVNKLTA